MKIIGRAENDRYFFPITQAELGEALGLSSVHANRMLQDIRSRDLMEFQQQQVTISNWDGLRDFARFESDYLHYLNEGTGK